MDGLCFETTDFLSINNKVVIDYVRAGVGRNYNNVRFHDQVEIYETSMSTNLS